MFSIVSTYMKNFTFNKYVETSCLRVILTIKDEFTIPRLDCCYPVFIINALRSLQLIQNAAARALTGIIKREHISPILVSLHWLSVESRV